MAPSKTSSHLKPILIVAGALVTLLILGLAGFAWRSQVNELKNNKNLSDQKITELEKQLNSLNPSQSTEEQSEGKYLVIKELGVKFTLNEDTSDAFYAMYDENTAMISTPKAAALSQTCDPRTKDSATGRPSGSIATVTKGKSAEKVYVDSDITVKELYPIGLESNGFYYYYSRSHGACSEGQANNQIEEKEAELLKESIKTLQAN